MPNEPETIHIKKYGNRRLYSSSETRFITIDQLADSVRRGCTVRVTDAETGEDITSEILTQILLEQGRAQHFPIELLEQMIRLNEQAVKSFWGGYVEQSRKVFENLQANWQESWQTLRQANPFFQWVSSAEEAAPHSPTSSTRKGKSSKTQASPRKSEK